MKISSGDYLVMQKTTPGLEPMKEGEIFRVREVTDQGIAVIVNGHANGYCLSTVLLDDCFRKYETVSKTV